MFIGETLTDVNRQNQRMLRAAGWPAGGIFCRGQLPHTFRQDPESAELARRPHRPCRGSHRQERAAGRPQGPRCGRTAAPWRLLPPWPSNTLASATLKLSDTAMRREPIAWDRDSRLSGKPQVRLRTRSLGLCNQGRRSMLSEGSRGLPGCRAWALRCAAMPRSPCAAAVGCCNSHLQLRMQAHVLPAALALAELTVAKTVSRGEHYWYHPATLQRDLHAQLRRRARAACQRTAGAGPLPRHNSFGFSPRVQHVLCCLAPCLCFTVRRFRCHTYVMQRQRLHAWMQGLRAGCWALAAVHE